MKKLFALLLALAMLLSLCACGAQTAEPVPAEAEEPAAAEEAPQETETAEPAVVTDYTVEGSDAVPTVVLEGDYVDYTAATAADFGDAYDASVELLGFFVKEDDVANLKAFACSTWPASELTLWEEAHSAMKLDFPEQTDLMPVMNDTWVTEGDYEYSTYTAFDTTSFEDYTYFQAFFFRDGDKIVEYDYWTPTYPVAIGDTGMQFFAPSNCTPVEPSEEDAALGLVAAGRDEDGFFTNYELYTLTPEEETDLDAILDWFRETYEVSLTEKYFFGEGGGAVECARVVYSEERDGELRQCTDYLTSLGDNTYINTSFYTVGDEPGDYLASTVPAMSGAFGGEASGHVSNICFDLGENLPKITLNGNYEMLRVEPSESYKTLECYLSLDDDSSLYGLGIYTWPMTCGTLLEEAEFAVREDYPEQTYIVPAEFHGFEDTEGHEYDLDYAYFTAMNGIGFEDKVFVQAYFFADGDQVVEIDYYTRTEPVPVGDTDWQFFLPKGFVAEDVTEVDTEFGLCAAYTYEGVIDADGIDLGGEFCNAEIYEYDAAEYTPESILALYGDVLTSCTEPVYYTYTSPVTGESYDSFYYEFTSFYDGVTYAGMTVFDLYDGKWIGVSFNQRSEALDPYVAMSAAGMCYGVLGM